MSAPKTYTRSKISPEEEEKAEEKRQYKAVKSVTVRKGSRVVEEFDPSELEEVEEEKEEVVHAGSAEGNGNHPEEKGNPEELELEEIGTEEEVEVEIEAQGKKEESVEKGDRKEVDFQQMSLSFEGLRHLVQLKRPNALQSFLESEESREKREAGLVDKRVVDGEWLEILGPVTGHIVPGSVTAVMGASGAGKTTLLDALANRYSVGESKGSVLVNGVKRDEGMFKRLTAYVKQEDIFISTATVEETLEYHARLRLPEGLTLEEKMAKVEDVLDVLDLQKARGTPVGDEFVKGISGGELKRLAIGAELLNDPSMLFLDEPTTGLDSSTAMSVMHTLRGLAEEGRTIITTIHQPRLEIFEQFDNLLLLSRGKIVYQGPAMESVEYFEGLGLHCPSYENPADWLLDLLSERRDEDGNKINLEAMEIDDDSPLRQFDDKSMDLIDRIIAYYEQCVIAKDINKAIESAKKNSKKITKAPTSTKEYPTTWWEQFTILLQRSWRNTNRNPLVLASLAGQYIFFALFVGLSYFQLKVTPKGVQDFIASIFWVLSTFAFIPTYSAVVFFPRERWVFNRERASGMYMTSSFYSAMMIAPIPSHYVIVLIFSAIAYPLINYRPGWEFFGEFLILGVVSAEMSMAMGHTMSAMAPTFVAGNMLATVATFIFLLTAGFFVQNDNLPSFLTWISTINPYKFIYDGYMVNQFKDLKFEGTAFDPVIVPCNATESIANVMVNVTATSLNPADQGATQVFQMTFGEAIKDFTCFDNLFFKDGNDLLKELKLDKFTIWENIYWLLIVIGVMRVLGFIVLRWFKIGKS